MKGFHVFRGKLFVVKLFLGKLLLPYAETFALAAFTLGLHSAKNMSVKLLLPPYSLKKLLYKVVDYPYCFRFCGLLLIAKRSRTGVPSRWNSIAAEPPAFGHTMTSSFWKPKVETIWFPFSFPAQWRSTFNQ